MPGHAHLRCGSLRSAVSGGLAHWIGMSSTSGGASRCGVEPLEPEVDQRAHDEQELAQRVEELARQLRRQRLAREVQQPGERLQLADPGAAPRLLLLRAAVAQPRGGTSRARAAASWTSRSASACASSSDARMRS